jgi:transposase
MSSTSQPRPSEESKPKRRGQITDDLLQRVSRVYRRAIEEGLPPKRAVQAAEGVSEPTAGRYIQRARERGFLGQTARGKKGEESR